MPSFKNNREFPANDVAVKDVLLRKKQIQLYQSSWLMRMNLKGRLNGCVPNLFQRGLKRTKRNEYKFNLRVELVSAFK